MSAAATLQKPETIRRRAVFVLPGYDPAPPRRYREIYRSEAAKQGEITGQSIGLSPVSRPAPFYGWQVSAQQAGRSTHSAHWILPWNDLVRSSMKAGIFGIYPLALRTGWTYLKGGALWALLRLRWQPMLAVFYPLAVLMGQVLVATAGAALGWHRARRGWRWALAQALPAPNICAGRTAAPIFTICCIFMPLRRATWPGPTPTLRGE